MWSTKPLLYPAIFGRVFSARRGPNCLTPGGSERAPVETLDVEAWFQASDDGRRRWARRRRVYLFSLPAVVFFLGPWISGPSFRFRIVVYVAVVTAIPLTLKANQRRAARRLPHGMLLRTVGSLLVRELPDSELTPAALGLFHRSIKLPWARRSGRLEVTTDALRWYASWGPFGAKETVAFEIPLHSVARIEVTSFRWPAIYAGLEIFGADGGRVAIESRDGDAIRSALSQTVLLDPDRDVAEKLAINWVGVADPTTAPAKSESRSRVDPRVRSALLLAAVVGVAFQVTVAPDASSTGLQDAVGAIWVFVGIAALISLVRASPSGPKLMAIAAAAGTIASMGDVTSGHPLGIVEVAVWGVCTLGALAATRFPLSPPTTR